MGLTKKEIGAQGETIAAQYLENKGFRIVERNWRTGHLEIDILAQKEDLLVVVEVKTHSSFTLVPPELTVSPLQKDRLQHAFAYYAHEFDYNGEFRFDVVGVLLHESEEPMIRHLEDVFF